MNDEEQKKRDKYTHIKSAKAEQIELRNITPGSRYVVIFTNYRAKRKNEGKGKGAVKAKADTQKL